MLSDRFLDSSLAYQGAAGGLGTDVIRQLHQVGSGGFLPDRTLLLELPAGIAAERASRRDGASADRIGGRNSDYHAAVAAAFRALAAEEPERFRIVDAAGAPEEVTARMLAAIEDLL